MTSKYVFSGDVMDFVAPAAVVNGQVVKTGVRIGVALTDIAVGATGSVRMRGVFTIAKLSSDVVGQGDALYWDATNSRLTTIASGNTLAGYAFKAAGNGVTTVDISLNA